MERRSTRGAMASPQRPPLPQRTSCPPAAQRTALGKRASGVSLHDLAVRKPSVKYFRRVLTFSLPCLKLNQLQKLGKFSTDTDDLPACIHGCTPCQCSYVQKQGFAADVTLFVTRLQGRSLAFSQVTNVRVSRDFPTNTKY